MHHPDDHHWDNVTTRGSIDEEPGSKKSSFSRGWVQADIQTHDFPVQTEFPPTPHHPGQETSRQHHRYCPPATTHHHYHNHWLHHGSPYRMAIPTAQHYQPDHHKQLYAGVYFVQHLHVSLHSWMFQCIHPWAFVYLRVCIANSHHHADFVVTSGTTDCYDNLWCRHAVMKNLA